MQVVVSCYKLRCVKGVKPCGTINSLPKKKWKNVGKIVGPKNTFWSASRKYGYKLTKPQIPELIAKMFIGFTPWCIASIT